jgi:MFS family permease
MIGTTIEFYDFYIYATAAVLVFPRLFFAAADPASAMLQSLATFALAFFARPVGSILFGHFGDRIGRKATLVAALLTMGLSTILIGLLPGYASIGVLAPVLLALCRFGQGLGLGGEWGGAVLLATENAPPGRRAWYGMFPQLGAPIERYFSAVDRPDERHRFFRLRMAHSVSCQCRAGVRGPVRAPAPYRDPGISARDRKP